jgi:acyl-CoA oxidase
MLGGHGYSAYSRLGRLFNDNDINTTWEGDNHMLLQQTTKYMIKSASKIQRGKMFG